MSDHQSIESAYSQKSIIFQYLQAINFDPNLIPNASAIANTYGPKSPTEKRHFGWVKNTGGFNTWSKSKEGGLLAINDRWPEGDGFTLSTAVVESVHAPFPKTDTPQVSKSYLKWFCDYFYPNAGATTITKQFQGQLVSSSNVAMPIANHDKNNYASELECLRDCIEAQPRYTPIFCFIDCITHYEDKVGQPNAEKLLTMLGEIAARRDINFPLKVLVTSKTSSPAIKKLSDNSAVAMIAREKVIKDEGAVALS